MSLTVPLYRACGALRPDDYSEVPAGGKLKPSLTKLGLASSVGANDRLPEFFCGCDFMSERQCPNCGAWASGAEAKCSECGEALPHISAMSTLRALQARSEIRQGLLYMAWSGILYFFAAGYGFPFEFPGQFLPILVDWVLPLWFLSGLGMVILGAYRHFTQ